MSNNILFQHGLYFFPDNFFFGFATVSGAKYNRIVMFQVNFVGCPLNSSPRFIFPQVLIINQQWVEKLFLTIFWMLNIYLFQNFSQYFIFSPTISSAEKINSTFISEFGCQLWLPRFKKPNLVCSPFFRNSWLISNS